MKLLVVAAFALAPYSVLADNYPTIGQLYSRDDDSVLSYICGRPQAQRLRCEFIRTSVLKKAQWSDLEKKLAEARLSYPDASKEFGEEQCKFARAFFKMASGETSVDVTLQNYPELASDPEGLRKGMAEFRPNAEANPELLAPSRAAVEMCDDPSEENFLNFTRAVHWQNSRTCSVTALSFTEEFAWVPGLNNDGAWIVSAQPEGLCGVLQLSRFEKDRSDTTGLFWRYIARRVVSNPTGELIPGSSCSTLDQGEQVFDWKRTRSDYMQCDFIRFSPF